MKIRSKSIFSFLLATAICTAVLSSANASRAVSSYVLSPADPAVAAVCASLGGAWNGPSTCTLGSDLTLNSSDSLVVDPNAVLVIPTGITVANVGAVEDYGMITTGAGAFLNNSGKITGFIGNGTITNHGTVTNEPDGFFTIRHLAQTSAEVGSFNFTNTGIFENLGAFVDFGNFTNRAEGSVTNSGSFSFSSATINIGKFSAPLATNAGAFTNLPTGTFTVDGPTFNNTGSLTNPGAIVETQNVYSVMENFGTISSNGTIADTSFIRNNGTIINSGKITTVVGCTVAACGSLVNNAFLVNAAPGTIENGGNFGNNVNATFTNYGNFTNARFFINNINGTVINSGTFVSSGTLTNRASIFNNASIVISGIVLNSGYIGNNPNGTITNSRTITNTGRIHNLGILNNACGGVIEGPGAISGNPVTSTTSCTTTTTSTPVPEFSPEMLVPVTLSILIFVTFLTRKGLEDPDQSLGDIVRAENASAR